MQAEKEALFDEFLDLMIHTYDNRKWMPLSMEERTYSLIYLLAHEISAISATTNEGKVVIMNYVMRNLRTTMERLIAQQVPANRELH